jgi:SAM-dependent methyltransferase
MATKDYNGLKTYDEIAESWYRLRHRTRFKFELEALAKRWKDGRLLNIGCAHGPDFLPFKDSFELWGLDSSGPMINMAVKYCAKFKFEANVLVADAVNLPFAGHSFDWVVAVATYHHISVKQGRESAFPELRRVLRPGGEAFITVWNRWQSKFWNRGKEVLVPWRTGDKEILRYYYLFTYTEIISLLKNAGLTVLKTYPEGRYNLPAKYFSRNICVLVRSD